MDPLTYQTLIAGSSIRTKIFNTPGTYSWTAPAGVNRIISLIGRGGSGTIIEFRGIGDSSVNESYFYLIDGFYVNQPILNQTLVGPNITYEDMRSRINNILLPQWQSITTNSGGDFYTINLESYNYFNSNWYKIDPYYYPARVYRRMGAVSAIGRSIGGIPDVLNGTGDIPKTGSGGTNIAALGAYASNIQVEVDYAYSDTNSTALGYTFFGQQVGYSPPTISTYTNIPVTPGTTYSIVVGQNYDSPTSFVELRY